MNAKKQPTEEELRFLQEMGMTEVEPGRWSSAWQGSDPGMQEWLDDLGSEGEEQLDLLVRAGRAENEFKMDQTGTDAVVSVQRITAGPLADAPPLEEHGEVALAVFVGIRESSAERLDALDAESIDAALEEVFENYETLPPPDAVAVALRKLGIKGKAININPHTVGPYEGPDPRDYPGFRAVLMHFPGAKRIWLD